jgi:hypothetical protein
MCLILDPHPARNKAKLNTIKVASENTLFFIISSFVLHKLAFVSYEITYDMTAQILFLRVAPCDECLYNILLLIIPDFLLEDNNYTSIMPK